jgi:hypothetical protein
MNQYTIPEIVDRLQFYTKPWQSHLMPVDDREALRDAITILGRVKQLEELENRWITIGCILRFISTGEEW